MRYLQRRLVLALVSAAAAALALGALCPGSARAYSLLDYTSAVDALLAVDPTLDPPPNDPNKDFVVGGFEDIYGFHNGFSAHSDPTGGDVSGHESAENPNFGVHIHEDVVCLAVSGNLAAAGDVGTATQGGVTYPVTEVLVFRDSGLPDGVGDGFDSIGGNPYDCASAVSAAAGAPSIVSGNILINDAP